MTLVKDVLRYLQNDYPGGFPGNVFLVNGADSEVFKSTEVGAEVGSTVGSTSDGRSKKADLARGNIVTVSPGSSPRSFAGTGSTRSEPTVGVKVEGLHEDERGHIADHAAFEALVEALIHALEANTNHPTTSTDADYHTLAIEQANDDSENFKDYYLATWDVRFMGYDSL